MLIREQLKEGADFIKIYETGKDDEIDEKVCDSLSVHAS